MVQAVNYYKTLDAGNEREALACQAMLAKSPAPGSEDVLPG
jgi:hypothetical protein